MFLGKWFIFNYRKEGYWQINSSVFENEQQTISSINIFLRRLRYQLYCGTEWVINKLFSSYHMLLKAADVHTSFVKTPISHRWFQICLRVMYFKVHKTAKMTNHNVKVDVLKVIFRLHYFRYKATQLVKGSNLTSFTMKTILPLGKSHHLLNRLAWVEVENISSHLNLRKHVLCYS